MAIDVRPIRDEELVPWLDTVSTGFLDRPDLAKIADQVRPHWDLARVWGAVDGDSIVGTTRTWATELTVPGNAQVPASAVTAVTVRPTYRRQGVLRRMLATEHRAARERGEVAALLYASDYPIYTRFGYGVGVLQCGWTIDVSATRFHDAAGGTTGSVEFVPVDEAAVDPIRGVFETWRRTQPGEIWRRPITWLDELGLAGSAWGDVWKGFLVVHRATDGGVDGYARYKGEAKWEQRQPRSTITINDLHGVRSEVRVALLRFLADIDLVSTLKLERSSPSDRLPWLLTNARATETFEAGDGMWVKVLDVPRALEARTYERSGSIVLEVIVRDGAEDDASADRVRVALDASPDGARAVSTDRSPDLTVDGSALGAAYLGGTRLRDAVVARGWDEYRAGALAQADELLACLDAPWCSTFF